MARYVERGITATEDPRLTAEAPAQWTFITFFGIFELGSVICGAAQSSAMLIVGRAVAGVGASALINGAITIVTASVPLEKRPTLTGIIMGGELACLSPK